ncbi:LysR family transcriptional regulator [Lichenifustis flavocetrariae]|uniref:LysR family transcriptional regulator n=1 Tax=Lichenifustis flavocetrariae TaxID=2949735 RepID=A0AA42CMM0_9HYPH|nr:LysR family transcriptional regulator [Lichenifustis flavocetrariae]MCW6512678.1 LysR family transcriptional regulator [Lichenifustis flavocetrariae]
MTSLRRLLPSSNALFVFEAAARERSFTRAAAELNVTQPAVSRMLGRLERHLGTRLFQRGGEGVSLTDDGLLLFRGVTEGFRSIEGALEELRRRTTGLETVTLSVSSAFATHWLMPRIGALQKACPQVDLRFQLIPGPLKGPLDTVDFGMRYLAPGDTGFDTTFFVNEVVVPVCSPAYRDRRVATGEATFIHLDGSPTDWIERLHAGGADTPHDLLHFADYAVVLQAALLGQGIALGWINVVSHALKTGALVPAGDVLRLERRCCLVSARGRPVRAAAGAVREWLVREMSGDLEAVGGLHPDLRIREVSLEAPADVA